MMDSSRLQWLSGQGVYEVGAVRELPARCLSRVLGSRVSGLGLKRMKGPRMRRYALNIGDSAQDWQDTDFGEFA